jgi:hypothetical protein
MDTYTERESAKTPGERMKNSLIYSTDPNTPIPDNWVKTALGRRSAKSTYGDELDEIFEPVKTAATPPKTVKAAAPSGKATTPTKPGGLSRSFEDSIGNIGKAPGAGKAVGTPAAKTATEVRRSVGISIAGQIRSRVRACAPSGIDINKIETFVTLSLEPSGKLTAVRFDRQVGVTDSNQPQAGPLKDCILQAVRAASPYDGLDPEYHDVWKTHALRLRATG